MGGVNERPVAADVRSVTEVVSNQPGAGRGLLKRLGLTPALVRYALLVFAVSRAAFIVVTLLAIRFLRPVGGVRASFLTAWARYDATYYARLARDGYQADVFYRAAFFPLQPLLTHLTMPVTGGNSYVAGIVVANVSFLAALLGLAALAARDLDAGAARRAMLYLTLFPSALFLFAGYAESLFLALALWCVVALRRGGWWQAGVLGLLATLTRQMGVFLVLPFLWEYASRAGWSWRRLRADVLWILLIPAGVLLFMGWLWHSVGDPLAFVHAEHGWHTLIAPPWTTLAMAVQALPHQPDAIFLFRALVDLAAVLFIAGVIVVGARRLPPGDTAYCAAVWVLALVYPANNWPLQSDARYMLAAFPCFLMLAMAGRRRWVHLLLAGSFGVLLLLMTQYFVRGGLIL